MGLPLNKSGSGNARTTRLVQMSDCHLGRDKAFTMVGINTYDSFSRVLAEIQAYAQPTPSLVAVTGDISCEGDDQAYQLFSQSMACSQLPYAWLPGNHDDFSLMAKVIAKPFAKVVELGIGSLFLWLVRCLERRAVNCLGRS